MSADLTAQRLREVLAYDADSGVFTWLDRSSQRVKSGDVAGSKTSYGYIVIRVFCRLYQAHRLAWFYVRGEWPRAQIDHIDGCRFNNGIANLRDVPAVMNSQNRRSAQSTSRHGFMGASRSGKRWRVQIRIDGKKRHIGCYATPELAQAAYLDAKRQFHAGNTL